MGGLAEGIQAGLQLRDYVENNAQKQEQAKLQAQLFKSQADHLDAQNQLIHMQVQQHATMQGLMQQEQIRGGLGDYLKTNPDLQGMNQATQQGRLQDYFVNNPQAMETQAQRLMPIMDATAGGGGIEALSAAQRQQALQWLPAKPLDMTTLAGLAGQAGLFKESAQLQQAAVEHQKVVLQQRTQVLQDQAGVITNALATLPPNDPETPSKRASMLAQLAALQAKLGKFNESLQLLQPKSHVVDVTQRLVQEPGIGGGEAKEIVPAQKTKAQQEAELEDARQWVRTHPPGTPYPGPGATPSQPPAASTPQATGPTGALQSYIVQEAQTRKIPAAYALTLFDTESGFDNAAVNPETGAFSVAQFLPSTATSRKLDAAKLTADPKYAVSEGLNYFAELLKDNGGDLDKTMLQYKGATSPEAQRAELSKFYQKYPAYAHQRLSGQATPPTPAAGGTYIEQTEAQREQTRLNTAYYGSAKPPKGAPNATEAMLEQKRKAGGYKAEGLEPENPANPIPKQRQEAEVKAQGLEPSNPANPVPRQRQKEEFEGQGLPVEVQTKLSSLNAADHYRQKLTEFSDAEIDKYVGLLRGKKADIDNLMANIKDASKGDPRRYEFLSLVNQIYYETNRPDTGANFSGIEKELVNQIYANGGERSSSEFKGKLSRLQDILATKKGTIEKAAITTRGEIKRGGAAPQGPTPGAAPATETVEEQEKRIRERFKIPTRTP